MFKDLLISIGIGIGILLFASVCTFGLFKLLGIEVIEEERVCNCCGCQLNGTQGLD